MPKGARRGTLEEITFKSESLDNERKVTVYLPPGYAEDDRVYPLLVVHQGQDWLDKGLMANSLDNLIGNRVAPVVVAFVNPIDEWWLEGGGSGTADYVGMLAEEFVPFLEQRYRLIDEAGARALMGTTYFGVTAAYGALEHPDVFGKVAVQSTALGLGAQEGMMELIHAGAGRGVQLYVDWNRYERRSVDTDVDIGQDNATLARALEQNGYEFTGGEVLDSFGWGSWRSRTDTILETFFPVK